MRLKHFLKNWTFWFLLVCVLGQPISVSAGVDSSVDLRSQMKQVYAEISELSSDTFCDSNDDCEVLGVGQEACGGPGGFEVYSKQIGDEAITKLQELAKQSATLAAEMHAKSQMMAACRVLRIPNASCVDNTCKIDSLSSALESPSPQDGGTIVN